jgi:hypothetical protein
VRERPPDYLRFDCGKTVLGRAEGLRCVRRVEIEPGPVFSSRNSGTLPITLDESLPDTAWKLTLTYAPRFAGELTAGEYVRYEYGLLTYREGDIGDGRPTAIDRAYWLVDFTAVVEVSYAYSGWAEQEARKMAVRRALDCGHEIDPALTWIRYPRRKRSAFASEELTITVSAPREPVRYPAACGDWLCPDDAHWADADPVDEPAVFAGAAVEKRYADELRSRHREWLWLVQPDMFRDAMTSRRRQAEGKPLWTIDVRPQGFWTESP